MVFPKGFLPHPQTFCINLPVNEVDGEANLVHMDEGEETHSGALTVGRVADEATVVEGDVVWMLGAAEVTVIKSYTEGSPCGVRRG